MSTTVPTSEQSRSTAQAQYRRTDLENGLRVATFAAPHARSVSIGAMVDASPYHDPAGKEGLAHLVEHALFLGTSRRDARDVSKMMDFAAGSMGGFTTRDYTCYHATVLDDHQPYFFELFGDLLLNSVFPPEELEREKQVVLRELALEADSPAERANTLLKGLAWSGHPLGRPVAGNVESVAGLGREDVIYFMHENYLPDRICVVGAGNLDHDDFVAQTRDALWSMLGTSPRRPSAAPPAFRSGVAVESGPFSQAYFAIGIEAFPYAHSDRYSLHLLNHILGGGSSSRLFHELREKRGAVYDVGSQYHAYRDAGMLVVEGSTSAESLVPVLGCTLLQLLELASAQRPVDEEELWKAKTHVSAQHLISSEISHTRMSQLATQEFYFGRCIPSEEVVAGIDQATLEDLDRLRGSLLLPGMGRIALAVVAPQPADELRPDLEQLLKDFSF